MAGLVLLPCFQVFHQSVNLLLKIGKCLSGVFPCLQFPAEFEIIEKPFFLSP